MTEKMNSVVEEYRRVGRANTQAVVDNMPDRVRLVESMFDAYARVERWFHWVSSEYQEITAIRRPVKSAMTLCYKSSLAIFCAYELTRHGFYGAAAPLLRQSYEALVIGKYCSLARTETLHERWLRGQSVFIGREILNKVAKADPEPLRLLWGELSQISYLSVYSRQLDLDFARNKSMVGANLVLIMMLIECTYHLLSTHVATPRARYYVKAYGKGADLARLARELKPLFRKAREHLSSRALQAVTCYKRKWTLSS